MDLQDVDLAMFGKEIMIGNSPNVDKLREEVKREGSEAVKIENKAGLKPKKSRFLA